MLINFISIIDKQRKNDSGTDDLYKSMPLPVSVTRFKQSYYKTTTYVTVIPLLRHTYLISKRMFEKR